jgi:hypothetical protein
MVVPVFMAFGILAPGTLATSRSFLRHNSRRECRFERNSAAPAGCSTHRVTLEKSKPPSSRPATAKQHGVTNLQLAQSVKMQAKCFCPYRTASCNTRDVPSSDGVKEGCGAAAPIVRNSAIIKHQLMSNLCRVCASFGQMKMRRCVSKMRF